MQLQVEPETGNYPNSAELAKVSPLAPSGRFLLYGLFFSMPPRHARGVRTIILAIALLPLLLAQPALAQPSWAKQPDAADKSGHTFVCEGAGASEAAALAAAFGVCNDKICKVCGVEVESVLKTKETLSGIGMERQVTERCRRIRKSEPTIKFKNVDCGPSGCRAWVQVFYSKADEEAECPRYADEKFEDPARCESDIEEYARAAGHSAEAFKTRRDALDRALADCRSIDIRPTPAIMALDAKLHAGLDTFATSGRIGFDSDDWEYYTRLPSGFRQDLRESKTLIGRIQKVRDYVHDRFLVFSVHDAAWAKDIDSAAGVQRLLAAMQRCPPGARFGAADDVNIAMLWRLKKMKTDTTAIGDHLRKVYPVESLHRSGNFMGQDGRLAIFFASDDKVTAPEWDYIIKSHQLTPCVGCLRDLLVAHDHGGDDVRLKRLLFAYDTLPASSKPGALNHLYQHFMPINDPDFLLRIEPKLPEAMRTWYDGRMWDAVFDEAKRHASADVQKRVAARLAKALGREPVTEKARDYCDNLDRRLHKLEEAEAAGLDTAYGMLCWCLKGVMKDMSERYYGKETLISRSLARHLSCRCPFDPSKTRTSLVFDWKKGQTPTNYGPYSERKAKFTIQVDPAWHVCAKGFETSRLRVDLFQGKTSEEALTSKNAFYSLRIRLDSPKDSDEGHGPAFCEGKPSFIGWEMIGEGEYAVLNSKRVAVPIHCE